MFQHQPPSNNFHSILPDNLKSRTKQNDMMAQTILYDQTKINEDDLKYGRCVCVCVSMYGPHPNPNNTFFSSHNIIQ